MAKAKRSKPKPKKKDSTKSRIREVGNAYQTGKDVVDLLWDIFGG
jgi:hypothetical protein